MGITFDGDVVVITGAGRGLGRAHALLLAELGARVVVNDIGGTTDGTGGDEGPAAEVVRGIQERGGTAVADTNNGSTTDGAQALIQTALDSYGRVDAVIANAGILRDKTFHKVSDEDFFAVVDVHLGGTVRVFHAAYPHMREQGYGRLVSTTSAAGLFGNFGQTAYAAAKMGIVGFTRSLALEGAKSNVKANVIAPMAKTRMTEELAGELAERLQPEKVSPLVACLVHPSLDLSGQIFSVGAGRFARVGIGVASGVVTANPDADFVEANLESIVGQQDLAFPAHVFEEMKLVLEADPA
jgi:NAD(P)-dependent dehydrogenase (short-subunit alcohol dehydrogenase family)